jgi:hypothetical protein
MNRTALGAFGMGAVILTMAPIASVVLLKYVAFGDGTPRIEVAARPATPTSTGDGWGEYRLAEQIRAAEHFLKPIAVRTIST